MYLFSLIQYLQYFPGCMTIIETMTGRVCMQCCTGLICTITCTGG